MAPHVAGSQPVSSYRRHPKDVLAAVEAGLRDLGLDRLYLAAGPTAGVLSVAFGVTAWCDGRTLRWRHGATETRWSAADALGAARQLAELAQDTEPGP
jgi:hypothetical protein